MSVFQPVHIVPFSGSLLSDSFSLSIKHNKKSTKITMRMFIPNVNTCDFPHTISILETYFPEVLETQCFNDENLPFCEEVKKTEIGHLFEHVLLEKIYQLKKEKGDINICVKGYTEWNWQNEAHGTFHISINSSYDEKELFSKAVKFSLALMKAIVFKKENRLLTM